MPHFIQERPLALCENTITANRNNVALPLVNEGVWVILETLPNVVQITSFLEIWGFVLLPGSESSLSASPERCSWTCNPTLGSTFVLRFFAKRHQRPFVCCSPKSLGGICPFTMPAFTPTAPKSLHLLLEPETFKLEILILDQLVHS